MISPPLICFCLNIEWSELTGIIQETWESLKDSPKVLEEFNLQEIMQPENFHHIVADEPLPLSLSMLGLSHPPF